LFFPRDDLIQLLRYRQSRPRQRRAVSEIAVHRDRQRFRAVASPQRLYRVRAHRFENGVRATGRPCAHRRSVRARGPPQSRVALLATWASVRGSPISSGLEAVGFAHVFEASSAMSRNIATACCHALSSRSSQAIAASGPGAISAPRQPGAKRVVVFARHRRDRRAVVDRQLVDEGQTDGRVGAYREIGFENDLAVSYIAPA
jgi:hypothetical protein